MGLRGRKEVCWKNLIKLKTALAAAGKREKQWRRHHYHRSGRAADFPGSFACRDAPGARGSVCASASGGLRGLPPAQLALRRCPARSDDPNTPLLEAAPLPTPGGCSPHTPRPHPEQGRCPPYLAAWRARCPSSEARTWTRSPGSTLRPRPGRATRRRGSGCAPTPRPPPVKCISPVSIARPGPARDMAVCSQRGLHHRRSIWPPSMYQSEQTACSYHSAFSA